MPLAHLKLEKEKNVDVKKIITHNKYFFYFFQMEELLSAVIENLFPDFIDHRSLLRVGSVSRSLYNGILSEHGTFYEYICTFKLQTRWKRIHKIKTEPFLPILSNLAPMTYAIANRDYKMCQSNSFVFKPQKPTKQEALNHLSKNFCRECFQQTTIKVRPSQHLYSQVTVCDNCSRKETGYSSLMSRDDIFGMWARSPRSEYRMKKRKLMEFLKDRRNLARRCGNRAHLYWRHQVIKFLEVN